jgi:hypothetical protein
MWNGTYLLDTSLMAYLGSSLQNTFQGFQYDPTLNIAEFPSVYNRSASSITIPPILEEFIYNVTYLSGSGDLQNDVVSGLVTINQGNVSAGSLQEQTWFLHSLIS